MVYSDRVDAGRKLSKELAKYRGQDAIVLALPRGGVVVGAEIARALGLPLDVIITRKIGAPGNPEYAIGAVAENGQVQLNHEAVDVLGVDKEYLDAEIARQQAEIARRKALYRGGQPLASLQGKTVILVDDGIATGFTALAAVAAARAERPAKLVLAVPVAPEESLAELRPKVDEFVCPEIPEFFFAIGAFYGDFRQVTDEEVRSYLSACRGQAA